MKNRLLVQTGYIFSESDVSLLKEFDGHLSDYLVLPWRYVRSNCRTVSWQNRRFNICGWFLSH